MFYNDSMSNIVARTLTLNDFFLKTIEWTVGPTILWSITNSGPYRTFCIGR